VPDFFAIDKQALQSVLHVMLWVNEAPDFKDLLTKRAHSLLKKDV
jgi:hypothetical protein